jgi:hemerythrin superfamily protein
MKNKKSSAKKISVRGKSNGNSNEESTDIVQLILQHHKPLKALIKIMKDEEAEYSEKKEAFNEFAPTLLAHAKPEEKSLYMNLKQEEEMKIEGLEGDVEHALADQLCEELKVTRNEDMFMAKVKVLAEMVEHHIKEEENHMLPDFKKNSTSEEREKLGAKYLKLRVQFGAEDESEMDSSRNMRKQKQSDSRVQAH